MNDIKIIFTFFIFLGISCNEDEFTIGSDFPETKTQVVMTDTFDVSLSTILLDSLETSGDSVLLIGSYADTVFGRVTCNSVFTFGLPESANIEFEDEYDSICLVLTYNGYSYGDTTTPLSFSAHQLNEPLEVHSDGNLYNSSRHTYNSGPLGSYTGNPFPNSSDSIFIRLDDELGNFFFNGIQSENEWYSTNSELQSYFPGIILVADKENSNCVISSNANDVVIRVYYHRYAEFKEDLYFDFALSDLSSQYNQIITDFSGSRYLSQFTNGVNEFNSKQTGNLAFMQGGVGMLQKVKFPTLPEILNYEKTAILKAELIIEPEKTSYFNFDLPVNLILYETDKYNNLSNPIYESDGSIHIADFTYDEFYHENTSYRFDITYYINNQIDKKYIDTTSGLTVAMYSSDFTTTLEHLVITSEGSRPILKIYYVTYK